MTPIAQWLNSAFAGFDYAILEFYHNLATAASPILTPISEFFAVIGDGAMACFILAAILILFPKTRKAGLCIAFAVGVGALVTNVAVKNIVARPRPYASDVLQFIEWWNYIGAPVESEFSFPSGHTTAAMAGVTGLCLGLGKSKKNLWVWIVSAIYVIVMGASRNYLVVHYPSDVIGGIIAGAIGGILGSLLIYAIYMGIECNRDNKFCAFVLKADILNLFKKK
jgi:undecaprenyl-diphosphatase